MDKKYIIDEHLINKILNFLGKYPYKDVADLISDIANNICIYNIKNDFEEDKNGSK